MKVKCLVHHNSSKLGVFDPGRQYKLDENDERVTKMLADFPDRFEEVTAKVKLPKPRAKKVKAEAEAPAEAEEKAEAEAKDEPTTES